MQHHLLSILNVWSDLRRCLVDEVIIGRARRDETTTKDKEDDYRNPHQGDHSVGERVRRPSTRGRIQGEEYGGWAHAVPRHVELRDFEAEREGEGLGDREVAPERRTGKVLRHVELAARLDPIAAGCLIVPSVAVMVVERRHARVCSEVVKPRRKSGTQERKVSR